MQTIYNNKLGIRTSKSSWIQLNLNLQLTWSEKFCAKTAIANLQYVATQDELVKHIYKPDY